MMKDVILYLMHIDDMGESYSFLSPEDYSLINKYKMDKDKKEHALSMYLKRKYIGEYMLNEYGKPINENKHFNVSHSYGLVGLAISDTDIGLDIELIRKSEDTLRRYISNDEEYLYIKDDRSFYELWCVKEGLVKALGTGINIKVNEIKALPINGKKIFMCKPFVSKTFDYQNYIINITLLTDEEINVIIKHETL